MNILVATPGRLLQHIEQTPAFDCSNVKCLVIDEVDRCLDMGFRKSLEHIVDALGSERQNLLFSATVDENVKKVSLPPLCERSWQPTPFRTPCT